jgi:hypothetical protein
MATTAAIEVVIRARDEATAAVTSAMQKITAEAERAATTVANVGRGGGRGAGGGGSALGMMNDLVRGMKRGQDAGDLFLDTLNSLADAVPRQYGAALKVGTGLVTAYANAADSAAEQQRELSEAFNSFDPAPFLGRLAEANKAMDTLAQRGQSRLGTLRQMATEAISGRPEERQRQAAAPVILREQIQAGASLRDVLSQREDARMAAALDRARELRRLGDVSGAAQAQAEAEASAARRLQYAEQQLNFERRIAEQQANAARLPFLRGREFEERAGMLREQAEQGREQRAQAAAQQQREMEEAIAQRRLKSELRTIEAEQQLGVAAAQAQARRQAAEAERLGTVERATEAQLQGILRVRDAELRAISETANARARAARGPTREEDVLAIRKQEALETTRLNLSTAEQVQQVTEQALQQRQLREEQFRGIQRSLGQITAEQELAYQQKIMAGAEKMSQAWLTAYQAIADLQRQMQADANAALDAFLARLKDLPKDLPGGGGQRAPFSIGDARGGIRPSDVLLGQFDVDEQLRKAKTARDVFAAGGTVSPQELEAIRNIPHLERQAAQAPVDQIRALLGQGPVGPSAGGRMGPITMLRNAAGELTIADDFTKATESATQLTTAVQGLSTALKDLQVSPGFAAKLSQDLADTLTFLGARHP